MKTKLAAVLISLLFMVSCGTEEQPKEETTQAATSNKMVLKASNGMYVASSGDTALIANQQDAANAEVFEKVDQGNGKWALKISNGKFVCADQVKGHNVMPNRDAVGDWEKFEILSLEGAKVNLKSSAGKFVCADQNIGGRLVANRDEAKEWETFTAEAK